ncbi:exodeoxyribonuclease I [Saccharospirillum impatiens]|uniref:exodeoxyribonuclease I n=1 Tax=Saccharospirillum impatiens TaxID=169438 RepID=UPI0003FE4937|nr:exodeoxyribonuclease I [Saccharospirillum impatiens]
MPKPSPTAPRQFLWYDYETWGINPARDGIAQFAAVITDADLNIIGEPMDWKCKPLPDAVIDPGSVMITGLTPGECQQEGMTEWELASRINAVMSEPGTCTVGYNSLRFDDEFTRFLLYRNLLDPYSREWRNQNSRWDLLDVVRMTHALRPEGIEWPRHENGDPSFKLEQLTAANGIEHAKAHDAVSDVLATIALARLIRDRQPKLFNYALSLRFKHEVRRQLPLESRQPMLHVSGRIPARQGCLTIEVPLMEHPDRRNEIIVLDLMQDPGWLLDHNADDVRNWLYSPTESLPEGIVRPPLRTLHLNRCPMIAPYRMLDEATCERFGIEPARIARHLAILDRWHDLVSLAREVFKTTDRPAPADPQQALYQGFIGDHDRGILNEIRRANRHPETWPGLADGLQDDRQQALVLLARARHFPDSLSAGEQTQWRHQVQTHLTDPDWGSTLTLSDALIATQQLIEKHPDREDLKQVLTWLQQQEQRWLRETEAPVSETITAPTTGPSQSTPADSENKENTDPQPDDGPQLGLF